MALAHGLLLYWLVRVPGFEPGISGRAVRRLFGIVPRRAPRMLIEVEKDPPFGLTRIDERHQCTI